MLPLAKKQIDIALTIEPSAAETHAAMGYWFHQTFKWKEAEKSYRKSIQLNPNQSNVYLWLAILLEGKSEKDLANEIYIKGMEINPEWEYLMQSRVKALMNTGNHEEAIKLQKHLIDKATFDLVLRSKRYAELSRLYWSVNNKDEAIQMATKAKDNGLLRFYKDGDNSFLVREVNEQYNVLRKSGDYISEFWMGLAYANAGSKDKALTCFGNAVVLKEAAVTLLLIDHYEFLNLKYLNFIQLKRSIKALINF